MQLFLRPVVERGRRYAFPAAWLAIVASGVGLSEPLPNVDAAPYLSFAAIGAASAASSDQPVFLALDDKPAALTFVRHEPGEPEDWPHFATREASLGHGRFAAPGNAADELAGFFRAAAYTLTDVRLGEAVPPIKVDRVPGDLGTKDGNERKMLFITAILPVVLEVNQRVLADREQLIFLRAKIAAAPDRVTPIERIWLEDLADRYDTSADKLDELVRRVDIVPPSMAIAQGGVESGWGTSFAARGPPQRCRSLDAGRRHAAAVQGRRRRYRCLHHQS